MEEKEKFIKTVEKIALKYAELVEKRIDNAQELKGDDLSDIYNGIHMLTHTTAMLERLGRIKN